MGPTSSSQFLRRPDRPGAVPHLDGQSSHDRHQGFLGAVPLAAFDPKVRVGSIFTVTQRNPRRLAQQLAKARRSLASNASLAIVCLARLEAGWTKTQVSRYFTTIAETFQVAHLGQESHRRQQANSRKQAKFLARITVTIRLGQGFDRLVEFILLGLKKFISVDQTVPRQAQQRGPFRPPYLAAISQTAYSNALCTNMA